MQLIGAVVPNITRGVPGQPGAYTLKPGQVLQGLGEAYGNVKAQQDLTKSLGGVAQQATSGLQTAPFGGTDPEAYGYGGNKPSLAQQATNLANYTPPTFGQTLAGASPAMRQQMLFPGPAIGRSALGELTGRTGQTPFERVFKEIQSGELGNLAQKREQMRGQVTSELAKDPFNPDLRGAQLALSPPTEMTKLGEEHKKLDQSVAYMTDPSHGRFALPKERAQMLAGAGLSDVTTRHLQGLEALRGEATAQRDVIMNSAIDPNVKNQLLMMIERTGMPVKDLEKIISDGATQQSLTSILLKYPQLKTLYSEAAPLEDPIFNAIHDEIAKENPTVAALLRTQQQAKTEKFRDFKLRERHVQSLDTTNALKSQELILSRETANLTNLFTREKNLIDARKDQNLMALAGAREPSPMRDQAQKQIDMIDKSLAEVQKEQRRMHIDIGIRTNPAMIVHDDMALMPAFVTNTIASPKYQAKSPQEQLAILDTLSRDVERQRVEYGSRVDAAMTKLGQPGWSQQIPPAVLAPIEAERTRIKTQMQSGGQPSLTPPEPSLYQKRAPGSVLDVPGMIGRALPDMPNAIQQPPIGPQIPGRRGTFAPQF